MKIEKLNYSRHPWRLLDSEGREVYTRQSMDHPNLGVTAFSSPVCGETKAECTANALALLEFLIRKPAA
jgi:hypothetical protein